MGEKSFRSDLIDELNSNSRTKEKKALYYTDSKGSVNTLPSTRTEEELVASELALAEYRRLANDAHQKSRQGKCSTLAYHMYKMRLEPPTLSKITGIWLWRVNRHLKSQKILQRLSDKTLQNYSRALGVSERDLLQLPKEP
ncbi:hypothetical protein LRD18_03450 [Halorhodospira halochloris]|uniref:hypothetical protein n=1 Tax=Halorhodospira halochloris TaxID=1052 RepID=UPI001EE7FBDC|nr:hypothetical protein [Halorhodospira halochloris]MCG5529927.1 hypothetical protein [Halorhodospira halochloris]